MQVVFILHILPEFKVLSCLCVMTQQMLLPKSSTVALTALHKEKDAIANIDGVIAVGQANTEWKSYYDSHSKRSAVTTKVELWSSSKPPENTFCPSDVMSYSSPSQGIWHPDTLHPVLMWSGGGFSLDLRLDLRHTTYFNPFAKLQDRYTVEYFTERLVQPEEQDKPLQWALVQYGADTKTTRGNRGIAEQHLRPAWLNKPQFQSYCKLRAYPNQQLRELCVLLHDRSLPLTHPAVHLLIRQTLYHVGNIEFDTSGNPAFFWKHEQFVSGEAADCLYLELEGLADELANAPRNQMAVMLLGEVAAYVAQWKDREVAQLFAVIAERWAGEVDEGLNVAEPQYILGLRAKQCVFYMYALKCFAAGTLDRTHVQSMCTLIVKINHLCLFEEPTAWEHELRSLKLCCERIMCDRIRELVLTISSHTEILTQAVRSVLPATPAILKWSSLEFPENSSCFEKLS